MNQFVQSDYLPKGYLVNKLGDVKSPYDKVLKKTISNSGYEYLNIKSKSYFIHRAIAFAFIKRINGKDFVNHKNGIKLDNRIENLEWCTKSENNKHSHLMGLNNYNPYYKNKLGKEHNRSKSILINGVLYNGISEASRKLNIGISTIHYRLNSKNCNGYKYS